MLLNPFQNHFLEAGLDEAGMGCAAGPVFAAAVILPPDFTCREINDSKKLSAIQRDQLTSYIKENAIACAVAYATVHEIDKYNILAASRLAMHRALDALIIRPQFLIIDGCHFTPYKKLPYTTIVNGDARFLSIAASSILAKKYRDDHMRALHKEFPVYNWQSNKGYPTREHRINIFKHGKCIHHRKSYTIPSASKLWLSI